VCAVRELSSIEDLFVKPSFGVVLPVRNAELYLSPFVHEVLDVLSDLASQFELLIVDDASTDHTAEFIDELQRKFPQIRVLTHPKRLGLVEAARHGTRRVRGDRTYILHGRPPLDVARLRRAWRELATTPPVCEHTTRRWKLHQRWRDWSTGQRLLRPIHRRATSKPVGGLRMVVSPSSRGVNLDYSKSEGEVSLTARERAELIVNRPDTVRQQCTAPLIPLRRRGRYLRRTSMFVPQR
jgi:hypothetical protein